MGKIVSKKQYSIAPNSRAVPYPPVSAPTPTDATIRELLRGYVTPSEVLPNAVLFTDALYNGQNTQYTQHTPHNGHFGHYMR